MFSWDGLLTSDVFRQGTLQTLETLRDYRDVNCIVMDASQVLDLPQKDIEASVSSTVDYLGISRANYRMAVVSPIETLAMDSIDAYVDSLNKALKKRFVVKQYQSMRQALLWLKLPRIFRIF